MLQNVILNEAETMKTWSGFITESTGVTDRSKLTWMSKYCAFHDMNEKAQLNESVYGYAHMNPNMNVGGMGDIKFPGHNPSNGYDGQRGSGDNPFSLLPLAVQVAAQTIALDLVPVVPMQGPLGILQYMDYVYEGGRTNRYPALGNADPSKTSPLMVKLSLTYEDGGKVSIADLKRSFKPGDVISKGKNPAGYELIFVAFGRIDGRPIFQVKEMSDVTGVATNGGENAKRPLYEVLTEGAYAGMPGTVLVENPDYGKNPADVPNANVTDAYLPEDVTFAVEDIDTVKALEDFIPGYTGAGFKYPGKDGKMHPMSAKPYSREQGESTPSNMMSLNVFTEKVEAKTIQVKGTITREQIQDLKAYGIDALAQVEAELVNELTQHINRELLDRIFALGEKNHDEALAYEGINLNTLFTVEANPADAMQRAVDLGHTDCVVSYVGGGAETLGTVQRRIMSKVLAASNLIAQRGRRGAGTFAVCSAHIATALQDCAGFVAYPLSNTINQTAGSLYPVGAISGVSIYVDPNMTWDDTRIVVGRKGKDNEPGLVFMPYLMADKLSYPAEGMEGAPVTSLKSRYAIVEAGHHPQLYYYTFHIIVDDGVTLI